MRTILYIIQKEFIQVFRNKSMLPIIFVIPIVQLIILVNAATLEMKQINMCVVDNDLSSTSRQMAAKFKGSSFYTIQGATFSYSEAESLLKKDKVDVILRIPVNFERDMVRSGSARVQVIVNAINGTAAGITNAYTTQIISGFNMGIIPEWSSIGTAGTVIPKTIETTSSFWYNPELDYKSFMVPAVLVLLVTIIGMFLSAMNLVREKELGTIEQINVTPIKRYQFIIGKLVPFLILALVELAFGLTVGKLLFDIPIVGNLGLLFFVAAIYLLVVLGLGLFLSTMTDTQQQAMFVAYFFIIVFVMMSGVFTPVENMPEWAQKLNLINPIAYFMKTIRMILLKGSGFMDILNEIGAMSIYAVISLTLAVKRYRKVA
jgi:ABC-2 type transport system permease protein